MTSAQDIKLGINDQLRLMTQCLESLNSKEMPCTLVVFGFIKGRLYKLQKNKGYFQTQEEQICKENRGILLSASCRPSIAKNAIILDGSVAVVEQNLSQPPFFIFSCFETHEEPQMFGKA